MNQTNTNKDVKIESRLKKLFFVGSAPIAFSAVLAIVAIFVMTWRYQRVLDYLAIPQADIGLAMMELAESRSALRATVAYRNEDLVKEQYDLFYEHKEAFEMHLAAVEPTMITEEGYAAWDAIEASLEGYWELAEDILAEGYKAVTDTESRQAQKRAHEELLPKHRELESALTELMRINITKSNETRDILAVVKVVVMVLIVCLLVASIMIANNIGTKTTWSIVAPVTELKERLETFAQGDIFTPFPVNIVNDEICKMTAAAANMAEGQKAVFADVDYLLSEMAHGNFTVDSKDERMYVGDFKMLLKSIRKLKAEMNATLVQVEEASKQVSAGSENLAESAQALAEGAIEQTEAIEELRVRIANITEDVDNTAKNLQETQQQARGYAEDADRSRAEMGSLMNAMTRINETSKKIENIIGDIEDIASQTNLLSLNASIEAARAGEAGRGFAVVADQIGKLAEQSAQSAVLTRQLIEESVREVEAGNKVAYSAAESLEGVVSGIKEIAEVSEELSKNSSAQAVAMEQTAMGVNQIADVVQSNSATAQETSATSEELSAQAISLNELIENFELDKRL